MAPNLITFIGFLIQSSNILPIFYYRVILETSLPNWVFFYAGITVFIYQTLDAVDGNIFISNLDLAFQINLEFICKILIRKII